MIKIYSGLLNLVKNKWYIADEIVFAKPIVSYCHDDTMTIPPEYHIDNFIIEISEKEYRLFKKFLPQYCPTVGQYIEFRGQLGFHIAKLLKLNWVEFKELSYIL